MKKSGLSDDVVDDVMFSFVWKHVDENVRGNSFEDWRWFGRYAKEGWERVGQLQNGFYPTIDFWKNGVGISFKSTNAKSWAALKGIRDNIDKLSAALGKELGNGTNKRLIKSGKVEVAIPKGNRASYDALWKRLQEYNTKIEIIIIEL